MTVPAWNVAPPDSASAAMLSEAAVPRQLCRLDARAQILIAAGLAVTAATTPAGAWSAFAGYAILLIGLLALSGVAAGAAGRNLLRFFPWVLFLVAPLCWLPPPAGSEAAAAGGLRLTWPGGGELVLPGGVMALTVGAKALTGCGCLLLLRALTPFAGLLRGLARLGVPRRLLTMLQLTERYGQVLQGEAARMQVAFTARGGRQRWVWQIGGVGRLIGALFVRSGERAERVQQAMLARGFDGISLTGAATEATTAGEPFGGAEWLWLAAVALVLIGVRGVLA